MSLDKIVKRMALSIGFPVIVTLGGLTSLNFYLHNDLMYQDDGNQVFQKADGVFAYTRLTINENGTITINRNTFGMSKFYTDNEGDGQVDAIFEAPGLLVPDSYAKTLHRNKHLEQHAQAFEKADQEFQQQMERFKPYLNR